MADLPIAPGQVYIEVDYDYEYKAKDRTISIHQGECYMLVKKTNEDWWQVRKEEGTKAFYVPAQYVREVRKALMPPPKPIPHPPAATCNSSPQSGGALWVKPTSLDLGLQDRPTENLHRHESNYRRSPSAQTASSGHFSPPIQRRDSNHHPAPSTPTEHDRALAEILVHGVGPQPDHKGRSSTLPRTRARSPELVRAPLDVDSTQHCDSAGEERRTNDSESGDELSSSSTEHLQVNSYKFNFSVFVPFNIFIHVILALRHFKSQARSKKIKQKKSTDCSKCHGMEPSDFRPLSIFVYSCFMIALHLFLKWHAVWIFCG